MGFFDGFKKVVQGKPIFDEQTERKNHVNATTEYHDEKGNKIYPELVVERTECRVTNEGMDVHVNIKNESEFPLVLDRLKFLGQDKKMPSDLSVGENMQFQLYSGPRPRSNRDVNFEIIYCNQTRDFFSAMYYAEFKPEADGSFSVKQFRKQRGIKDIA